MSSEDTYTESGNRGQIFEYLASNGFAQLVKPKPGSLDVCQTQIEVLGSKYLKSTSLVSARDEYISQNILRNLHLYLAKLIITAMTKGTVLGNSSSDEFLDSLFIEILFHL